MFIFSWKKNGLLKAMLVMQALLFNLKAQTQVITTIAGVAGTYTCGGDGGQATDANLWGPSGIVIDTIGNIFVAEQFNYRIRKINTAGIITTIAGNGTAGYSGDGGFATAAEFKMPTGLAFDRYGNLFVSDQANHCVRKINTNGIISTIAGTSVQGYSGDGGQATLAQFTNTSGLFFDKLGNLYIGDLGNGCVRKVDTNGIITTFAGTGTQGNSGDGGQASLAKLNAPAFFLIDSFNNFYISDEVNNNIRKINSSGIISTINGISSIYEPEMIALDRAGNLYVTDYGNNRIIAINALETFSNTIAGTGIAGYSGDGGVATAAQLNEPLGIAFDAMGNLYITDSENSVIRKVSNVGQMTGIHQFMDGNEQLLIYPNPATNKVHIDVKGIKEIQLYDLLGNEILSANENDIDLSGLTNGVYFIRASTKENNYTQKIVVQH